MDALVLPKQSQLRDQGSLGPSLRGAEDAPSLVVFKARLDGALGSLVCGGQLR